MGNEKICEIPEDGIHSSFHIGDTLVAIEFRILDMDGHAHMQGNLKSLKGNTRAGFRNTAKAGALFGRRSGTMSSGFELRPSNLGAPALA